MFGIRNLVRANQQVFKCAAAQQRNMSVVAIPARKKVSKGEMIVLGSLMVIGWSIVPAWVLVNIKKYRDHE